MKLQYKWRVNIKILNKYDVCDKRMLNYYELWTDIMCVSLCEIFQLLRNVFVILNVCAETEVLRSQSKHPFLKCINDVNYEMCSMWSMLLIVSSLNLNMFCIFHIIIVKFKKNNCIIMWDETNSGMQ